MILSLKQRILSCKGTINKVYFMSYTVIFIVPIFISKKVESCFHLQSDILTIS